MPAPHPKADLPPSPRAAALLARLQQLNHRNDALELRLAVARQQLKAAEARADADPGAALQRIERAQHRLRRAG